MTQTKVLVTGGAGYIGSQICHALHTSGFLPITIDNLSKGIKGAVQWGPFHRGDITDSAFVEGVLQSERPSAIIHCAALTDVNESTSQPCRYYRTNVYGSLVLLEAVKKYPVQALIVSSTCAVYGNPKNNPISEETALCPISPYGWSKLMMERMVKDFSQTYHLPYGILRYFNAAGADVKASLGQNGANATHLIPIVLRVAAGEEPVFKIFGNSYPTRDGTAIRDFIHVIDLAKAHVLALKHLMKTQDTFTLNLGSGSGHSVLEVLAASEQVCQCKIARQVCSPRAGDPAALFANSTHAHKLLGWKPDHTLHDILESAWQWKQVKNP